MATSLIRNNFRAPEPLLISEVQIIPVKPQRGLVAFASCVINNSLYVGNIAIHTSLKDPGGYRLVYPDKVLPNGKLINCVYPINQEAGEAIRVAIIGKYMEIVGLTGGET